MPNILSDLSPPVLAKAIEDNGTDCCLSWAEWPEMELGREEQSWS